ncbi:acyl-CoA synthetase [Luminiphilus syltensis NOR5-1B]|uniref:Acyl-CoA synthetase n=2 Tax=Luminiphilus TaxID=1341118 RepID=B8KQG1_9GAMM|nr:acyl-CoA synthetase [Luminiphilus syltensis NOR5-1B]
MMHLPLGVRTLTEFGARHFASSRVGDYQEDGSIHWQSYTDIADSAARLANALTDLGFRDSDRVGTFMWNCSEHLQAYLAIPSMGGVMHTINCRLSPEHIAYIINHAEDRFLIVDGRLESVLAPALADTPALEKILVVNPTGELAGDPRVIDFADVTAACEPSFSWPEPDENRAAGICYTSGTTGNPKGVVYSQKTTYLHALASRAVDTFGVNERDTILMLPSMFHANAWGFPYSGWLSGADMVMPGPHMQVRHLEAMIEQARPTLTAMVPTVLSDLIRADEDKGLDLSCFRSIICGGSAVPSSMIEAAWERWKVPVVQGWGMTETSPMCVLSHPPKDLGDTSDTRWRMKSGRPVPGIEVRVVDAADRELPNDGQSVGELQLRGTWVTGSYLKTETDAFTDDGWLKTGDVGHIDARGYVQLTDRTKDVIKSGGEWISSVDLEDALLKHPDVLEVAVIATPDERWQERPLAVVVPKSDKPLAAGELRGFLLEKVAKFWIPEYWAFVDEIAKTSIGKIDKKTLRDQRGSAAFDVETCYDLDAAATSGGRQ